MANVPAYGGQTPTGAVGGEIAAGRYRGPETEGHAPWKCPACAAPQEGRLELGCTACGAGKPGVHVGVQPPTPAFTAVQADLQRGMDDLALQSGVYVLGETWAEAHPTSSVAEAFVAGYLVALRAARAHTLQAPPVTADLVDLAPAGKPTRTIIAALELFKDQVLRGQPEEVVSGEWCSVDEVDQLIQQLQERRDD